MKQKIIIGIIAVVITAAGVSAYFILNKPNRTADNENASMNQKQSNEETTNETGQNNTETEPTDLDLTSHNKTLVVYYSATGSTRKVAEQIAANLNADIFEIVPENIYTADDLNWNNENSRVSKEHNDETLRDVPLTVSQAAHWEDYDTVFIGYPIWWGVAAWPTDSFVKNNDFQDKTVIPFCTSASSGIGNSDKLLSETARKGNWQAGHRFSSNASNDDIKAWIESLK